MANAYTKVTLADIKRRIKDGQYDTIAGANRAIGKASELTDSEKDSARRAAASHFGEEAAAPRPAKRGKKAGRKPKAAFSRRDQGRDRGIGVTAREPFNPMRCGDATAPASVASIPALVAPVVINEVQPGLGICEPLGISVMPISSIN